MRNMEEAEVLLIEFIKDNMDAFYDDEAIDVDDNIFDKGYASSLFAMRLLNFIESTFDVTVPDNKIQLVNFSTITNMIALINELVEAAS